MIPIKIIKTSLTFIIPYVALLILIPYFFNLELDNTSIGLLFLGALFIALIINIYRKIGHQGQFPIWIGLALLGLSALALYSSVSINGSEKMIELDARSQGYVLIGAVIGGITLLFGLKSMANFSYGLGNIKGRR
jgi:hypothetical protein